MARIEDKPSASPEASTVGPYTFDDIYAACCAGDADFIKALVRETQVDFDYADRRSGMTPLHYAAAHNARDVVVTLIESRRANPACVDALGRTPATLAYEIANNPALGRYLLKKEYERKGGHDAPRVVTFPAKKD